MIREQRGIGRFLLVTHCDNFVCYYFTIKKKAKKVISLMKDFIQFVYKDHLVLTKYLCVEVW